MTKISELAYAAVQGTVVLFLASAIGWAVLLPVAEVLSLH